MPALLRRLSPVGLLTAALCATAGPGYLPKVGPPPVRFERPTPAPAEPPVVLPPLAVIEPRPTSPQLDTAVPAPVTPNEPVHPVESAPPSEALITPERPALMMEPPSTNTVAIDQGILGPQMFMKYFTGQPGTNGSGISIFAPVGFVPPLPATPPSSSASFQTTPPGKP